ncbi:MAG: hypothetical protein IKK40_09925 [Bacteroidales bacterium]|nr:hypothetical protein [Bacteroidales bacterium]
MEKKIIFFIALLLCATNALAEDIDTTMFTEFGFKGKVKTVTCFYSKEDFGDIVKDKDAIYSFSYDNLGNLKETRSGYNHVSRYYIYEGNKLTQILISDLEYINSTIKSYDLTDSISLKYDDKGNLIEKNFFSIIYHTGVGVNKPDNIYSIEVVKESVINYKYNENNKLIEDKLYDKNGSLVYTTIYKYDTNGLLIKEKRIYAPDHHSHDYEDEYDYSYVYGTSKKIIRDSCFLGSLMGLDHRYSYDESSRLKKIDYNFYLNKWTPEGGKEKTQYLPRQKVEYTYNTAGEYLSIKYFNYNYPTNWNWRVPDKCNGTYKTDDFNYVYNNSNNITSRIHTEYRRKSPNNNNDLEIIPKSKIITKYTYDSYGNWIEKRVYEIKDGIEFFKEGVIREISYYE